MQESGLHKTLVRIGVLLSVMTVATPRTRADETYPAFSQRYWENEEAKAHGKIMRGAALGATGLAVAAPTAVLGVKAADNPQQYLAYSAAVGIAALGMTLHGFVSIGFGRRQQEAASRFVEQYKNDPNAVDHDQERQTYLTWAKKSAGKMTLFGIVLGAQGALLLADGIVLSSLDADGSLEDGVKIWPAYLIGGLLLAGGTTFAVLRGRKFVALRRLGRSVASPAAQAALFPLLGVDPVSGSPFVGLGGALRF